MQAHKLTIVIPESHEVTIKLPANLPTGEAEVIVLTATIDPVREGGEREPFRDWLARLHAVLPPAPVVPLEALRREHLYEDD